MPSTYVTHCHTCMFDIVATLCAHIANDICLFNAFVLLQIVTNWEFTKIFNFVKTSIPYFQYTCFHVRLMRTTLVTIVFGKLYFSQVHNVAT